jgi:hypothetical protein
MGENAFALRVNGAKPRELDAVVLHRRDGTRSTTPLRPPWGEGFPLGPSDEESSQSEDE